jgi:hypothetical protein
MQDGPELPYILLGESDGNRLHHGIAKIIGMARALPLHDLHPMICK